ncbi:MAG TPA: hypothetical protein VK698_03560 [Kofleriaceae bacterium]|nr:hypothetical protein [Kofleriaceae bacterium]
MPTLSLSRILALAVAIAVTAPTVPARAEGSPRAASGLRDGRHDFDFLLGRWKFWVRRLKNPLHGSREWYEMTGTSVVKPILNGLGNIDEFKADGSDSHVSAVTIRLYSTTARQWSIYWANQKNGRFDVPTVGEFKDGRGEFYDQEMFEGRSILVRYIWSNITPRSAHFEQSFSPDGGKTWEVNWISQITRIE